MRALAEALRGIRENKLMSFLSLGVVGISLFVLGLFLLTTVNVFRLIQLVEEKVEIVVYLEDGLSQAEALNLRSKVEVLQGVEKVEYVSKDEALARLKEDYRRDPDLVEALEVNPLPPSFEISMKRGFRGPESLSKAAGKLMLLSGVEEVDYGKEWVERLNRGAGILVGIDLLLGVLFSFASAFLVSSTIRLTVSARREQIEIMKLVGATQFFIQSPFLVEGILQGVIGGGLASLSLYGIYRLVSPWVGGAIFLTREVLAGLIGFGALLGYFGSLSAVGRFLLIQTRG